jgi:hypothetical protein
MAKYYVLAALGAAFAAAVDSYVVLALTLAITLLLYQTEVKK